MAPAMLENFLNCYKSLWSPVFYIFLAWELRWRGNCSLCPDKLFYAEGYVC